MPPPASVSSCVQAAPSVEANALRVRTVKRDGVGAHDALVGPHRLAGRDEQRHLLVERDLEGVDLAGARPVSARGRDGRERARAGALGWASATASARASARSGPARERSEVAAKPQPPPARTRTPDALGLVGVEALDAPVHGHDETVRARDPARVGVGAASRRRLHEPRDHVEHVAADY